MTESERALVRNIILSNYELHQKLMMVSRRSCLDQRTIEEVIQLCQQAHEINQDLNKLTHLLND